MKAEHTKGKILVVDDDRLVLATVVHGLAQAGYEVIDADNGDDAILLAREHQPELALLDIRMEGKSGFDVAAYLREYCRVPFMFLSAFSDDETVAQVKALGAVAYMVKPLDVAQIVPAVDAAFARLRAGTLRPLAPPAPSPVADDKERVAMAVGVLMHRYSLTRTQAAQRLQRMAEAAHRGVPQQADALLQSIEELARGGEA